MPWLLDRWIAKVEIRRRREQRTNGRPDTSRRGSVDSRSNHADRDDVAAWLKSLAGGGGQLLRQRIVACRVVLRSAMAASVDEGLMRQSPAACVAVPKLVVKWSED